MNKSLQTIINGMPDLLRLAALSASLVLAGCAAPLTGGHLVPGQSTAAEVEATMGAPREKVAAAGGVTRWFYPRGPVGQETYAVNVGSDGVVKGVEQTLTYENAYKIKAGTTTSAEALALLGPPNKITRFEGRAQNNWEYRMYSVDWKVLTLEVADDGVVRGVMLLPDPLQSIQSGGECQRC